MTKDNEMLHSIPNLVLDTNVYIEQRDFQDLANRIKENNTLQTREIQHRRRRAKYSILLGWFCHLREFSTAFAEDEAVKNLLKRVDIKRIRDVPTVVTFLNNRLVHEQTLTRWVRGRIEPIDWECSGTEIDNILLDYADKVAVPLLTNEGNTPAGYVDFNNRGALNLRGKAKRRGVAVFSPEEYLRAQGFDIAGESRRFYDAFMSQTSNLEVLDLADQVVASRALEVLIGVYIYILHAP